MTDRDTRIGLAVAILLGVVIRTTLILQSDFPLNDGGMFHAMVRDIQAASYALPAFTSYNSAGIPFAYSPLPFYIAALVDDLTPLSLLDVFRVVPLAASCLVLVAFAALARVMLRSGAVVVAAVFAFAVVPRSFVWTLMGGGLTRAFGFLFAILTLHAMYLLYTRKSLRYAAWAALWAGLTILSHLGTAPFVAFSSALLLLAHGRHLRAIAGSVAAAIGAAIISAPWWGTVLARHGAEPFLAAQSTGSSIFSDPAARHWMLRDLASFASGTTGEPFFPLVAVLALLGALALLPAGRLLLPAWWLITLLLDTRAGATYATVPLSMLAGFGVSLALVPLLSRPEPAPPHRQWALLGVVAFLLFYATAGALLTRPDLADQGRWLRSVAPEERAAMTWVAQNTPADSRFLVLPVDVWWADRVGEWFPALAERQSVTTVQGYEWLPGGIYQEKAARYDTLRGCLGKDLACVEQALSEASTPFDYIFVPLAQHGGCCPRVRSDLEASDRYRLVHRSSGAEVYERAS